jgi:hypothetical protein
MNFANAKEWRDSWQGAIGEWRDKKPIRAALLAFDELGGTEDDRAKTLGRIAIACLHAMQYKKGSDPGEMYRKKLSVQRKGVSQLSAAARTLAKACQRGDRAMLWALPGSNNDLKVSLGRPHDDQTVDVLKMGGAWFSELEQTLKSKLPELHGGPFFERFTAGNLHFEKAIAVGRKIEVSTMLAFELTFYLRMFTAGRAGDILQTAQPMPTDGKPCPAIVASFCSATLTTDLDNRQVTDRLRKLPTGIGLMPWPIAE